jgi:hypothetical protein
MKTAFVVGMLTLSATVAGAHNKDSSGSATIMRSNATAGIGRGANSQKARRTRNPIEDDAAHNHLTR